MSNSLLNHHKINEEEKENGGERGKTRLRDDIFSKHKITIKKKLFRNIKLVKKNPPKNC